MSGKMNKFVKGALYILICIIMFICGFFTCQNQASHGALYLPNQTTQEDNSSILQKINIRSLTQEQSVENIAIQKQGAEGSSFVLTNTDIRFLEDHLYGQWRFSERLSVLDESKNNYYDSNSNISYDGVDALKENIVISYEKNSVWFPVNMNQTSFTSARDMFLFGEQGGFQSVQNPIYLIEVLNNDIINLKDIYYQKGHDIRFSGAENFLKVSYYIHLGQGPYTQKMGRNFANVIYIDPNNTDTIYVDFCGLWEMERDYNNYRTGGKSIH